MLDQWMGQAPNASEHGVLIDKMLEFCHWFMLILFVGWSTFFIFTLFRFHKSRHPKADYRGMKSHFSSHIEFIVVLVEAVLLVGFAFPLWGKRVLDIPKAGALRIRVVGQQFQWNFHYPGRDGVFGKQDARFISSANLVGLDPNDPAGRDDIVVPNEIHLPVNQPVVLEISSKDVIHSFSVPAMRIGQDAIPGTRAPVWFQPVKTGDYEIICGQLCGQSHYNMRAIMTVDSPEDYAAWLKQKEQLNTK